jgi:hypothetical protein
MKPLDTRDGMSFSIAVQSFLRVKDDVLIRLVGHYWMATPPNWNLFLYFDIYEIKINYPQFRLSSISLDQWLPNFIMHCSYLNKTQTAGSIFRVSDVISLKNHTTASTSLGTSLEREILRSQPWPIDRSCEMGHRKICFRISFRDILINVWESV